MHTKYELVLLVRNEGLGKLFFTTVVQQQPVIGTNSRVLNLFPVPHI